MGLVLGWEQLGPGHLRVRMCVTSPGCTLAGSFMRAAEQRLLELPELDRVDVVLEDGPFWTEERLAPSARGRLAERRRRSQTTVKPQMWRHATQEDSTG
jgi:metal-sulfur cluster biosynthetic enzyme